VRQRKEQLIFLFRVYSKGGVDGNIMQAQGQTAVRLTYTIGLRSVTQCKALYPPKKTTQYGWIPQQMVSPCELIIQRKVFGSERYTPNPKHAYDVARDRVALTLHCEQVMYITILQFRTTSHS
jgi:hypothetical protein